MTAEQIETYTKTYNDFLAGNISAEVWYDFVFQTLDDILEENKDVLVRLKDS